MVVCLQELESKQADEVVPGVGDDRMVCHVRRGRKAVYYWTHHDERGRLLLTGPEHKDRWEAHRLFLAAIADQIASGKVQID